MEACQLIEDATELLATPPAGVPVGVIEDALLKRMQNLTELCARSLPRSALLELGIDHQKRSTLEVLEEAERQGLLADSLAFAQIMRLPNRVVHDYPLGRFERGEVIAETLAAAPILLDIARNYLREGAARGFPMPEGWS